MKSNFYQTIYRVDAVPYASSIYATSKSEAEKISQKRNLGEFVTGAILDIRLDNPQPLPSIQYEQGRFVDAQHNLIFLNYIAACSGCFCHHEMLSDHGILHLITHELHKPKEFRVIDPTVIDRIDLFEHKILGLRTRELIPSKKSLIKITASL